MESSKKFLDLKKYSRNKYENLAGVFFAEKEKDMITPFEKKGKWMQVPGTCFANDR